MNNAYFLENLGEQEIDNTPRFKQRMGELAELLEALDGLAGNVYYQKLVNEVINPRLEDIKTLLHNEDDPIKIYRYQGGVRELEGFNLQELSDRYRLEYNRIKGLIK